MTTPDKMKRNNLTTLKRMITPDHMITPYNMTTQDPITAPKNRTIADNMRTQYHTVNDTPMIRTVWCHPGSVYRDHQTPPVSKTITETTLSTALRLPMILVVLLLKTRRRERICAKRCLAIQYVKH